MKQKFPSYLRHEHTPEAIKVRLSKNARFGSIRDFVYGAIDGTVTTFSIVAGVSGAELSTKVIIILGISNILSDGFSMAASNYLGTKAEQDEKKLIKEFENNEIAVNPAGEKEEIRQIYGAKGFQGEFLEQIVEMISKDRDQWIRTMMAEEYGLGKNVKSPLSAGAITFFAFLVFGLIPMLPFFFGFKNDFLAAAILTGCAFYLLGALKSIWSLESAWISGPKTFIIGSVAASLAYIVGILLKNVVS